MSDVVPRRRRNLAVVLGCALIAVALLLSGSVLESTVFPPGSIVGTSRRAAALGFSRLVVAVIGLYLLVRRPRITTVHLTAMLAGTLTAGIIGALFLQVVYDPVPLAYGWRSLAPLDEQNQLGFRGHKITYSADDYVVVLLGDSQVEATALSFDSMPECLLGQHLGRPHTKVFSVGTGGYGQDQELLALQEYFDKYRADLVVLWETPGNDIWNNLFKTHMYNRTPKPTFWLDDYRRLAGPSESLGQPMADSRVVLVSLFQRTFLLPWRDVSWERRLPEPYKPLAEYHGPVRTDWQERWNTNEGRMRDEKLDTEKSHLAVGLTPRSTRMLYGLDLTRALLQRIRDLGAAHHAGLVVFQTDTDSRTLRPDGEEIYVLNKKYYRVSRSQFDANWHYVNAGFDAEFIPVTIRDYRVSREDGHLNMSASDQVIADLAARLQSRIAASSPTSYSLSAK